MSRAAAVALCLLAAAVPPAWGADDLLLAGASGSGLGNYSYLGALIPLGEGRLGQGWVMRQWVDRITYQYNGFAPDIHAAAYGYAPALGYQWALAGGADHVTLYGGAHLVHTSFDPYDPGNADRGTHARLTLQGELTSDIGARAQNQLLAEGEFGNGAYFVRDRLLVRLFGHYTIGPEVIAQGSHEYQAHAEGVCLGGIALTSRSSLLVRAGMYQQSGRARVGNVGIELAASL